MGDSKDRGWEFLTSKDFDGNDDDGSWGSIDSDGSGYYHGADGSWGSKDSDGSGYYHGADGSWGSIDSDGSGYYHGADGSWGSINSDGSSSFYGADGSSEYKNADADDDDDSYSSDSDSGGSLLGAAIGLGILGVAAAVAGRKNRSSSSSYEDDEDETDAEEDYDDSYERESQRQEELKRYAAEQQRQEKARIKKEKKKAFRKKHWKGILIAVLIVGVALFGAYKYWEYSKLIPVGTSSNSLIDKDYESVAGVLKDSGFTNVHTTALYDLNYKSKDDNGLVAQVTISGSNSFDSEDKYPYDSRIVIEYHSVARETAPMSAKEAKGEQYQEIVEAFENAGFGNVVVSVDYDLITGWINGAGEVESISINGETAFEQGNMFAVDAKIEIVYHDFKKNNPNK